MPGHHHRAGGLRQSNKRNKRSKASKRSITRAAGGKVAGKAGAVHAMAQQSKADRRNFQQQKRNAARQELLRKRRGVGGLPTPPRVVGIISLGANQDIESRIRDFVAEGADRVVKPLGTEATVSCKFDRHKKDGYLTLLTCKSAFAANGDDNDDAAVLAALDLARVSDLLLMVVDGNGPRPGSDITEIRIGGDDPSVSTNKSGSQDWDHLISERGDRILTALKSQGLPTPLTVLAHTEQENDHDNDYMTMQSMKSLRRSRVKRQLDLKKYVSRLATTEFGSGNDKVIEVDLSVMRETEHGDAADWIKSASAALLRTICSMSAAPSRWVAASPRPYLLSDTYRYDEAAKELHLTGFVRGPTPIDVNSLFHVPGVGTFPCKCVEKKAQPVLSSKRKEDAMDTTTEEAIIYSDPELRESSEMFAVPDALEGEQNLIGFDEVDDNNLDGHEGKDEKFARPAGWSDYQSAWLDAVDEDELEENEADHGELAADLNQKPPRLDGASVVDAMDLDDANEVSAEERQALLEQRRKEHSEHLEFPDEVQVDEDANARDRFARYRSLKSFRKSYWDPKENLPQSYASLFHFRNFKATERAVKNDVKEVVKASEAVHGAFWGASPKPLNVMEEEKTDTDDDILEGIIPSGCYVTLTLENVPSTALAATSSLLTAVSLLEHENKVSVLHMGLCQSAKCDVSTPAIKSKDTLVFRCGWRTWKARPTFSQHNLNCDKHKFERFLPPGGAFFAASVFGPVTYTPCPVLVFREKPDHRRELVAVGSMIGADADRIVVKRIILTGYPVRVHKRYATVKYMFYNPDDVKWFRPAGLYTKHGLQGHIIESVGEHGTMKCLFNAPIKQHDTVCLPLYKRIYPKFATERSDDGSQTDSVTKTGLVIR